MNDKMLTTGYYTFVWGNLVTWRSKKQTMVVKSSVEVEFRALTYGICELLWLKILLNELKFMRNEPMKVYCDNKVSINISHNLVYHDKTKHAELDCYIIKEN